MEFYRSIPLHIQPDTLQKSLTLEAMEDWSTEFFALQPVRDDKVQIGGLWGVFTLQRTAVKGGVRFTLIECPNALTWSITTGHPPKKDAVHVHLTVNRTAITDEFKEEIEDFIKDHIGMLSALLSEHV
jgi:hypothetical protein